MYLITILSSVRLVQAPFDGDDERSKFSFGEGTNYGTYATLGSPIASNLTWEKTHQYDLGFDLGFFNNRLGATIDLYIRDTKDMLAPGVALPSVYGATSPKMNVANLRTKGYEIALNWNDSFELWGNNFSYGVGFNLSDYKSTITKYDNPNKTFAKDYYVGMELGEIWVYETDGFFKTDEEAREYTSKIDHSYDDMSKYVGSGWQGGDLKFVDRDGDGKIGIGDNTVNSPGDQIINMATSTLIFSMASVPTLIILVLMFQLSSKAQVTITIIRTVILMTSGGAIRGLTFHSFRQILKIRFGVKIIRMLISPALWVISQQADISSPDSRMTDISRISVISDLKT